MNTLPQEQRVDDHSRVEGRKFLLHGLLGSRGTETCLPGWQTQAVPLHPHPHPRNGALSDSAQLSLSSVRRTIVLLRAAVASELCCPFTH